MFADAVEHFTGKTSKGSGIDPRVLRTNRVAIFFCCLQPFKGALENGRV